MLSSDAQLEQRVWDVAIIGAGMGGGFTARALSEAGHDVLLIEYGNAEITPPAANPKLLDQPETRLEESKWPTLSAYEIDGVLERCYPPIGVGVGGSANWYAAALERFDDRDIDARSDAPHPTGGWPVSYNDLLPYYEQAERLLHVRGTPDPLNSHAFHHISQPPPLGPRDADFLEFFKTKGLHPYRLHVGIRYWPGCDECLGRLCYQGCRADVRSVLAESSRKPVLLSRSKVVKLEASADCVTSAIVLRGDQQMTIRAKVFVLAAGALHTPKLLLQSANQYWPQGVANRSGLVGRNLMFHANQAFVLWPGKRLPGGGPRKSLVFKDFYCVDGNRLGCVQSTGFELGYGQYLMHLYGLFDRSAVRKLRPLRGLLRIPALMRIKALGLGTIFACLIEDLPYPENRVVLDENEADGIRMQYTIKDELRQRVARLRKLLTERLEGRRMLFLSQDVELNYGHPCGTCVMSDNEKTGVVDRDGRTWGLRNLFITDASFMPTSAAINPSLTVAANALRVSRNIDRELSSRQK